VLTGILLSKFWSILGAFLLSHNTSLILAHDENRRTRSCCV